VCRNGLLSEQGFDENISGKPPYVVLLINFWHKAHVEYVHMMICMQSANTMVENWIAEVRISQPRSKTND
jgi:hypothetical protein